MRFYISLGQCARKTLDAFSESKKQETKKQQEELNTRLVIFRVGALISRSGRLVVIQTAVALTLARNKETPIILTNDFPSHELPPVMPVLKSIHIDDGFFKKMLDWPNAVTNCYMDRCLAARGQNKERRSQDALTNEKTKTVN